VAGGKRGPYKCRPALPSEISNYASQHGAAAAAWGFSRKLEKQSDVFRCDKTTRIKT